LRNNTHKLNIFSITFICALIFTQASSSGAAEKAFGHQIFALQKKQAEKGNTLAQFKLGTYYEFGISVEINSDIAKVWYIKASRKNYKPAINRLTYLDIKEKGYNEYAHAEWFKEISEQAKQGKANPLIILGQMYHSGIIVKKNLPKALSLLRKASLRSHVEVDAEIALIRSKIDADNNVTEKKSAVPVKNTPPVREEIISVIREPAAVVTRAKQKPKSKPRSKKRTTLKTGSLKNTRAEKERRYKEAMWKIHQENMQLQQTQQWSEDDDEDEDDGEDEQ